MAITNETGAIVEQMAYDAWGKRRPATTWQTPNPGVFVAAFTLRRGFTLHEHIDHVGLIHMGGRVYDPEIGRFLSPDPFVQFPASTQGFNRYAYVSNNPLSYTDPSGYFLEKLGKKAISVGIAAVAASHGGWIAVIGGAVAGYLATGSWQGAAVGAMPGLGAMADLNLSSVGMALGYAGMLRSSSGNSQGSISAAGGGRFGDGALGVYSGAIVGPRPSVVAATVSGTASPIGGGKFANGASSASFASTMDDDRGIRAELDHRVCNDTGVTCTSLGVQERLTFVDSAEVLIREVNGTRSDILGKLLDFESARRGAGFSLRARATVEAVSVDLFRIHVVEPISVAVNGAHLGTFDGFNLPTSRFVEVVNGSTYQRPASLHEAMVPPRYPTRINWAKLTGTTMKETDIQRWNW